MPEVQEQQWPLDVGFRGKHTTKSAPTASPLAGKGLEL